MAASTGILLTAGAITAGNEWIHHPTNYTPLIKIGVATMTISIIFAGIEHIPGAEPFAVGVAAIALIGTLLGSFTPGVPSPAQQILSFMGYGGALCDGCLKSSRSTSSGTRTRCYRPSGRPSGRGRKRSRCRRLPRRSWSAL